MPVAIKNRYPDCLAIALQSIPSDDNPVKLSLTAEFGEQWEPLSGGRVKFGLKSGQFRLCLPEGMQLPELANATPETASYPELPALHLISASSAENERLWRFRAKQGQILQGRANFDLVELSSASQLEALTATFSVKSVDLSIAQTEDLWKHDITPNQHAVLDRAIALFLQQYRLSPYLSAYPERDLEPMTDGEPEALQGLQQAIAQFSTGSTDDFLKLAAIAQLDPASDFAGGNLMAVDLSGLDFRGANLCRVNLRGANLNDTDFSEASLTLAKLMGADLSGAYLGNSNLGEANLHRASLALANLGGADASGANFQEANLSNTNLAGVKVEGALFGSNPGLTEEMKESLIARGATFKED